MLQVIQLHHYAFVNLLLLLGLAHEREKVLFVFGDERPQLTNDFILGVSHLVLFFELDKDCLQLLFLPSEKHGKGLTVEGLLLPDGNLYGVSHVSQSVIKLLLHLEAAPQFFLLLLADVEPLGQRYIF